MRHLLGAALIALVALGFMAGAGYLVYWQRAGTPAVASVNHCARRGRAVVCRGSWTLNGRVTLGEIENASASQIGQRIEVRVLDGRAMQPGLRLPIVLFVLGVATALGGVRWWTKERVRT